MNRKPIDQKWIQDYVSSLIEVAQSITGPSPFREAIMQRASNVMDLVEAWNESEASKNGK